MSELTNARANRNDVRWRLLTTVSAAALLASVCTPHPAKAADGDIARPPLWIELGGQFAQQENGQEIFLPPFMLASQFSGASQLGLEKAPPSSWDGIAKIAFEPSGTGWIFSAGILYGKSSRNKYLNQEAAHPTTRYSFHYNAYQNFAAKSSESHTIADFQAGKDVGLGMFGSRGSSIVGLGVRYAQFNARNTVGIQSQPTNANGNDPKHTFYGTFSGARKFTGIGPSLSWDASASLIGNPAGRNITLDWGLNGAVLFGRQEMRGHHQTTNFFGRYKNHSSVVYQTSKSPSRSKEVIVPNLGGFAGVSWRYPNAKVSLGYRADFFFGAMDGGIDATHRENVGFYGPFASIGIGLP